MDLPVRPLLLSSLVVCVCVCVLFGCLAGWMVAWGAFVLALYLPYARIAYPQWLSPSTCVCVCGSVCVDGGCLPS